MKVTNYFLLRTILDSGFIAIKLGCSRKIITLSFLGAKCQLLRKPMQVPLRTRAVKLSKGMLKSKVNNALL